MDKPKINYIVDIALGITFLITAGCSFTSTEEQTGVQTDTQTTQTECPNGMVNDYYPGS